MNYGMMGQTTAGGAELGGSVRTLIAIKVDFEDVNVRFMTHERISSHHQLPVSYRQLAVSRRTIEVSLVQLLAALRVPQDHRHVC